MKAPFVASAVTLCTLAVLLTAAPAAAQCSPTAGGICISPSTGPGPDLGQVIRGSADTTFTISTSDVVSQNVSVGSGGAKQTHAGANGPPSFTVQCVKTSKVCKNNQSNVTITVTPVTSGNVPVTGVSVAVTNFTGTASPPTVTNNGSSSTITYGNGNAGVSTVTFKVGASPKITASGATGTQTYTVSVNAAVIG